MDSKVINCNVTIRDGEQIFQRDGDRVYVNLDGYTIAPNENLAATSDDANTAVEDRRATLMVTEKVLREMPKEDQQEVYEFMHTSLGLRIYRE